MSNRYRPSERVKGVMKERVSDRFGPTVNYGPVEISRATSSSSSSQASQPSSSPPPSPSSIDTSRTASRPSKTPQRRRQTPSCLPNVRTPGNNHDTISTKGWRAYFWGGMKIETHPHHHFPTALDHSYRTSAFDLNRCRYRDPYLVPKHLMNHFKRKGIVASGLSMD